ncbi:DeoR/GlpR family DNA-binding transcription regulator [Cohaesibacter celericrescens]|uniref:DeoR family transcriptional regulator n=1 Tax=Cohaesibacter celericrescens TaxID=2067669 RepID=A0A2N5XPN5_9HYPH|nr:DeoR/GlpR family DNA-binding transcription regulator [Cohaesibacter celericrescens]PLW76463.1 DeoR family transcriptional regulator [Cohaesibacter celericrescens]
MRGEDRRQMIMDLLVENRAVDIDDLSERFAVSKMTIHRDLDELEQLGVLRKVRGGATADAGTQFESDFRIRARQDAEAKERMAREALKLIEPGMTVMINDGSMSAVLGSLLTEKRPLTVITNNESIIDALRGEAGITLLALGGIYSAKYNGYFGVVTEETLCRLRADIAFISAPAVSGLQAFHMDDNVVRAKVAMMAAASRKCLLVNHSRFDRTALHVLSELENFDCIITDDEPDSKDVEALAKAGLALTVARP